MDNLRKKTTKIKAEIEDEFVEKSTNLFHLAEMEQDSEYVRDEERFLGYVFLLLSEMIGDVMELVKLKYKEMLHIYLIYS